MHVVDRCSISTGSGFVASRLSIRMVAGSRKLLSRKEVWLREPDTYRIYNYCPHLSAANSSIALREPHQPHFRRNIEPTDLISMFNIARDRLTYQILHRC